MRYIKIGFMCLCLNCSTSLLAQVEESPLKIFGYFQNSLQHWTGFSEMKRYNSFSLQQLNIFMQKDLGNRWTTFLNVEFLNSFSTQDRWGAMKVDEAWVKYDLSRTASLKMGLMIPIFNNLNDIKNKTPLLPYIIRPIAYESSFGEFLNLNVLTPNQAFIQLYGFIPRDKLKLDYAFYVGNSPNIAKTSEFAQSGIDTTTTFMVGGRVGVRYKEVKLGFSATYDLDSEFQYAAAGLEKPASVLQERPRTRLAGDFSFHKERWNWESEVIFADLSEGVEEFEIDLNFYYGTLGYELTDNLYAYYSYWRWDEHFDLDGSLYKTYNDGRIHGTTAGIAFQAHDYIRLKLQAVRVYYRAENEELLSGFYEKKKENFSIFSVGISAHY